MNVLSEQAVFSCPLQAPFLPWGAKINFLGPKVTARWTCLLLSEVGLHGYGPGSSAEGHERALETASTCVLRGHCLTQFLRGLVVFEQTQA